MKKNIIIGAAVVIAVILAFAFINSRVCPKVATKKPSPAVKQTKGAPVVKTFAKDMGGLTVRMMNAKNKDATLRVRAFRMMNAKESVFAASFTTNRMQELIPGNYDIEVDTVPQALYKNIRVSNQAETIEDLGATGSIMVKLLNSKKKEAYFPVRILQPKTNKVLANANTNRSAEMIPGTYDIDIGTNPKQTSKDVRVEGGKETVLDIGCVTGSLTVKVLDENAKEARYGVRVKRQDNNEQVAALGANRSAEILQGTYVVEVLATPVQSKKDVKITAGEETIVEFSVKVLPVAPARASVKAAPPAKARK